jgi:hypothetical protein
MAVARLNLAMVAVTLLMASMVFYIVDEVKIIAARESNNGV